MVRVITPGVNPENSSVLRIVGSVAGSVSSEKPPPRPAPPVVKSKT